MGGRGRGRGQSSTFTMEQLGIQRATGEGMPGQVLQPPPTFPPLEYHPFPLPVDTGQQYLVATKRALRTNFRESHFFIKADLKRSWLSEMSHVNSKSGKKREEKDIFGDLINEKCWGYFPKELIPGKAKGVKRKKKATVKDTAKKPKVVENVLEKLTKLEEKDTTADPKAKEEGSDADSDKEDEEEDEEKKRPGIEEEELVEDEDEEMDDGTDYACNYFEPGDDYVEDGDDDMDEGGVY